MNVSPPSDPYIEFLRAKVPQAQLAGFTPPSAPHASLFFHQSDIATWGCKGGRRAIFANFGLGKTRIHIQIASWVVEKTGGKFLIIAPLGVRQEFTLSDGPAMGVAIQYVRDNAEVAAATASVLITNYERVRDGGIDCDQFAGVGMDEASVLRSYGSQNYQAALKWGRKVAYRFVFTATPSPNRYKELIHYAAFLGVMDSGEALTRFFQRDSEEAGNLTLYPHMEAAFWAWVASWAVFIQRPSDLGYSDEGYDLPAMEVHWHRVGVDHTKAWAKADSWGQHQLFMDDAAGLAQSAKVKRESIGLRISKLIEIIRHDRRETGLSEAVLCDEQGSSVGEAAEAKPGVLSQEPGEGVGSRPTLGQEESGESEGIAAQLRGEAPGEGQCAQPGLVSTEPTAGGPDFTEKQAQALRADAGDVRRDASRSKRRVRNLRSENDTAGSRSLSQDGEGARPALPEVQHSDRSALARTGGAHASSGLPDQIVIWCDLNEEQVRIERELKTLRIPVSSMTGAQDIDEREELIADWKAKETSVFLSKPVMYGAGVNLQQCHTMVFIGVGYKFQDFIQGIHRVHRFQQQHPVHIHIVYLESEDSVVESLKAKWARHDALMATMSELLRKNRLQNLTLMELTRTFGCERAELTSAKFRLIRNDCVHETRTMPADSVDLICTSIPFGTQYEYSPAFEDFGHNPNNAGFFEQMDFLCPELLRVLRPGRIAAIHVKDRIRFGNVTGDGFPIVDPFSDHTVTAFTKAGFRLLARITIDTDVVRENNQTYRLGWSENAKDSSKMGAGMPEYVLVFRKLPSDTSDGYADVPVKKDKATYTRADWQIDAAGIWRSSGDRLPEAEVMRGMTHPELIALWKKRCLSGVYSHAEHVATAKALEEINHLPSTFMLFAAISRHKDIWSDISRMLTLNTKQAAAGREKHVCPLQLDIIKRLIIRYTNPGETVFDPFMGIGSVGYQAIKLGRHALGTELNLDYWKYSIGFCEVAEREMDAPTLFDVAAAGHIQIEAAA